MEHILILRSDFKTNFVKKNGKIRCLCLPILSIKGIIKMNKERLQIKFL